MAQTPVISGPNAKPLVIIPPSAVVPKLDGTNYLAWQSQALFTIRGHGLSQYLDPDHPIPSPKLSLVQLSGAQTAGPAAGAAAPPPLGSHATVASADSSEAFTGITSAFDFSSDSSLVPNSAYHAWYQPDQILSAYLVSTLSPTVFSHVMNAQTAAEIWKTLHSIYAKPSQSHIMQGTSEASPPRNSHNCAVSL